MMVYIIIVSGNYCYMLVRIEKERVNLLKIRIIYFYNFALSFQLKKIKNIVVVNVSSILPYCFRATADYS